MTDFNYPRKNVYKGRRYVPKTMGEWDSTGNTQYESLSVVTYHGDSYTSKQDVPKGVVITESFYWVRTAIYNAQLEIYRQEVINYKTEIELARKGELSLLDKINLLDLKDIELTNKIVSIDTKTKQLFINLAFEDVEINSLTSQTVKLNNILSTYKGMTIVFPDGRYLIDDSLIIYSNTKLQLSKNAEIFLMNGVSLGQRTGNTYLSKHLIKNHQTLGLQNIEIEGGIWNGNGVNQDWDSMRGIRLNDVVGLKIHDLKIKEVNGWGICHFNCNNFHIYNIELDQMLPFEVPVYGTARNSDGITGTSSNGIIENIKGYCNDDIVALNAGNILYPIQSDIENVIIRDIISTPKNGQYTWHAPSLYGTGLCKCKNITIDNVSGIFTNGFYFSAFMLNDVYGGLENINIANVNFSIVGNTQSYLTIKDFKNVNNINLNNINIVDNMVTACNVIKVINATIENINVNNLNVLYMYETNNPTIILDNGMVKNINLLNVMAKSNTRLTTPLFIYDKLGTDTTTVTTINGSNIDVYGDKFTQPMIPFRDGIASKIRLNSFDISMSYLNVDKTKYKKGNRVFLMGMGCMEFDGTNLVPTKTLAISKGAIASFYYYKGLTIYDIVYNKILSHDGVEWRDASGVVQA